MSQYSKPSEPPLRDHRRPTLKIHEEKGSLTIQTEQLAIQAIFSSPILQAANYIQQLEKYCLRAALSGLNLKVQEYDSHYTRAKDRIDETFNTLTYKSMNMIQDLLLSLRLLKIEMWREQTAIANGLRTHLYQKNVDPYGFSPSKFDEDLVTIYDAKGMLQESVIEQLSLKLKQHQAQKMEDMFCGRVLQPYRAQNKDYNEVDPSSIYESLLAQVKLKLQKYDETLQKRHANIQEQIIKFMQFTTDHNMRAQKIAQSLIKRYNEFSNEDNQFMLTSIVPVAQLVQKKQTFNADDLFTVKQYRSELKPAFANRVHNVQIKNTCKVFDPETGNLTEVQFRQPEENHREWDRYGGIEPPGHRVSPFDSFSERKRNNPKEFYQLREFQKQRYRQEQQRMREKDRNEREREREKISSKKIIRIMSIPAPWADLIEYDNPFLYFYVQRRQKESAFWDIKQKETDWDETVYSVKWEKTATTPMFKNADDRGKNKQQIKKETETIAFENQQMAINFQIKRREEESVRLVKLQRLIQSRSYEKFMTLSKWQMRNPPFCDSNAVSRYGITFNINIERSKDLKEVENFFYRYFKQRYYRENQSVRENADNPIITLDSSKYNMNTSGKIISQYVGSIVKKVQTMPFFIIWGEDILVYRSKSIKQGKKAHFAFYPYYTPVNSQKLMYQIRRRIYVPIVEEIKPQYCKGAENQKIYSKVEVAHRAIFDRHKQPVDMAGSVNKGRQIVKEIFDSMRNGKL